MCSQGNWGLESCQGFKKEPYGWGREEDALQWNQQPEGFGSPQHSQDVRVLRGYQTVLSGHRVSFHLLKLSDIEIRFWCF